MVEQDVYDALKDSAGVTGLVATRIYPLVRPQTSDLPAITYQRVASQPITSLDGDSQIDQVRIQIDCWSRTYGEAKRVADAVRIALRGKSFKALPIGDFEDYEPEPKLYRFSSDYSVWQKT